MSGRRRENGCLDSENLSRTSVHTMTESKRDVLAFGLNFGIAPKAVLVVNIIAVVESAANEVPEEKDWISAAKKCLQNTKKPKSNLGKEQREALRKLREVNSDLTGGQGKCRHSDEQRGLCRRDGEDPEWR